MTLSVIGSHNFIENLLIIRYGFIFGPPCGVLVKLCKVQLNASGHPPAIVSCCHTCPTELI